jgi:hypothetical protein
MSKVIEHPATTSTRPELKREMGLWTATAMVVGNMIGSGVFLLPASLGAIGSISIVGWLVAAFAAALIGGVFADADGRDVPEDGRSVRLRAARSVTSSDSRRRWGTGCRWSATPRSRPFVGHDRDLAGLARQPRDGGSRSRWL